MLGSHLAIILSLCFFWSGLLFCIWQIKGSLLSIYRSFYFYLFVYISFCFGLTLFPLPAKGDFLEKSQQINLQPFSFCYRIIQLFREQNLPFYLWGSFLLEDVFLHPILNVLLFVPFGVLCKVFRKGNLICIMVVGSSLSLVIEVLQLTGLLFIYSEPYRLFELDDILLNTLGVFVGYTIFKKRLVSLRYKVDFLKNR